MSSNNYQAGQRVLGKVTALDQKSASIQLKSGIIGFLPLSELSWTRRINRPSDVLEVGMEIETVVTSFHADNQTLFLSFRRLEPNPWDEMHLRYPTGRSVKGILRSVNPKTVSIELEEGINGFFDENELSTSDVKDGQIIEAWVVGINKDQQKLFLSLREPKATLSSKKEIMSMNNSNKIKLHMCESWITYANKGQVDIDIAYFPLLKEKTKEEVAKWVTENAKDLWIDQNSGIIFPSQTTTKEEYIKENDLDVNITAEDLEDEGWEGEYKDENRVSLWSYFNDASIDFEKIKNEEHFFSPD